MTGECRLLLLIMRLLLIHPSAHCVIPLQGPTLDLDHRIYLDIPLPTASFVLQAFLSIRPGARAPVWNWWLNALPSILR